MTKAPKGNNLSQKTPKQDVISNIRIEHRLLRIINFDKRLKNRILIPSCNQNEKLFSIFSFTNKRKCTPEKISITVALFVIKLLIIARDHVWRNQQQQAPSTAAYHVHCTYHSATS